MQFLADMGIAWRIVEWLKHHSHDAVHLRELGLHKMPDNEIFDKAKHEKKDYSYILGNGQATWTLKFY